MVKIRKQIRNLHDTTLNGQRVFDAIVEGDKSYSKLRLVKENLCRSLGKMLYPRWMQQKI